MIKTPLVLVPTRLHPQNKNLFFAIARFRSFLKEVDKFLKPSNELVVSLMLQMYSLF